MNAQIELMDHNQRNIAILTKLMGRKLNPEQLGLLARLRALTVRAVPVQFANANQTEAQHEATQQLAGMMAPERQLVMVAAHIMHEVVA